MDAARPPISRILIVDDDERNRELLTAILETAGYELLCVSSGLEALAIAASWRPSLIVLDAMMPVMDGFQTAERLKLEPETHTIPIIMVTALNDRNSRLRGLSAGADDFLNRPVDRIELTMRVRNLVRVKHYNDLLENYNVVLKQEVEAKTAEIRKSHLETLLTLTQAAEFKDEETGAHLRRISHYTAALATRLGLDASFIDLIFNASPMHDVGKIGIPDHILLKPSPFTPQEWEIMKTHSELGARLLRGGDSPYMQMGTDIAYSHHERWDGTGYPRGLTGEEIPLSARVMGICDQYDALRSKRPYKEALTHETAVRIITRGDGRTLPAHFDPDVLAAFIAHARDLEEIFSQYVD